MSNLYALLLIVSLPEVSCVRGGGGVNGEQITADCNKEFKSLSQMIKLISM